VQFKGWGRTLALGLNNTVLWLWQHISQVAVTRPITSLVQRCPNSEVRKISDYVVEDCEFNLQVITSHKRISLSERDPQQEKVLRGYLTQCTTAAIISVTWPKQYMTQWNISRILVTWLKPQVGSGESIRAM